MQLQVAYLFKWQPPDPAWRLEISGKMRVLQLDQAQVVFEREWVRIRGSVEALFHCTQLQALSAGV